jgi:protein-S-isoprenylcysteine O-methyltransferase Ste14
MEIHAQEKTIRKGFWAALFFYLLIAFEFFYMASPFAVYFYSVYRPGFDVIGGYPQLAWLFTFFLPHIAAETGSPLINLHNPVGIALAAAGFAAFCVGAGQVYYRKLAKKGAAVGGIYRYIRHPQYLSLMVCGLGLLFLWPRYIVLVMYVTVLLAYRLLARLEEKECLARFGESYEEYMKKTGMFLPFRMPLVSRLGRPVESKLARAAFIVAGYLLIMGAALGAARGVEHLSVASLYGYYTADSATVSLIEINDVDLKKVVETAMADGQVTERLVTGSADRSARYLNYVLPADRYVSEIPMNPIEGAQMNHFLPSDHRGSLYRVVITRAVMRDDRQISGRDILLGAVGTIPLAEVLVDAESYAVVGVEDPAIQGRYEGIPMPVF